MYKLVNTTTRERLGPFPTEEAACLAMPEGDWLLLLDASKAEHSPVSLPQLVVVTHHEVMRAALGLTERRHGTQRLVGENLGIEKGNYSRALHGIRTGLGQAVRWVLSSKCDLRISATGRVEVHHPRGLVPAMGIGMPSGLVEVTRYPVGELPDTSIINNWVSDPTT